MALNCATFAVTTHFAVMTPMLDDKEMLRTGIDEVNEEEKFDREGQKSRE